MQVSQPASVRCVRGQKLLLLLIVALLLVLAGCGGVANGTPGTTPTPTPTPTPPPPPTPNPGPQVTFTANPTTITAGSSSTLTWTTTGASSVSIAPAVGTAALPVNGSVPVQPTTTTTYTLTATAAGGATTTQTATVTVSAPIPSASPVQHLIVVMMQNSSFDHMFGTFPNNTMPSPVVNGLDPTNPNFTQIDKAKNSVVPTLLTDPTTGDVNHGPRQYQLAWDNGKMDKYALTNGDLSMQFYDSTVQGKDATGNLTGVNVLWNYAQQFALADNFFASAMSNEPANILFMVAADPVDSTTATSYPQADVCTPAAQKNSPGTIAPPLSLPNVGDQLTAKGVTWAWMQENFSNKACVGGYVPQENAFQYFQTTANGPNVQRFVIADFKAAIASGTIPNVVWIQPSPANDMHPGGGSIFNGISFLDDLVKTLQTSNIWANTAVLVLWDESGGWYDHVSPPQWTVQQYPLVAPQGGGNLKNMGQLANLGARVPVMLISPLAKKNYVSHAQMDFVSITRFIQANWGLGRFTDPEQLNRENLTGDLCDLFDPAQVACTAPQ
jgi:phospholipase C